MAGVDVGTAYLTVVPSAKGFAGNLQKELGGGMASAGKDAGDKASSGFSGAFKAGLAGVVTGLGLNQLAESVLGFAKDSIAEARESQKVGAITAQVIKTTGGAAKVSADQVGDLATAISNKTGIDDEAIQSGANLLLTFKNVRNEVGQGANIFDRATQAATDLSAAGFGDMATTSKQLGKALNDPIAGITALSRSGVTFTEQQKAQIKTLVASGKTLEAQKIILGEVESQVGGTAAASATAGEKLATTFGNFKEQIGTALLPVIDKVATFLTDKVIPAASQLFSEFQSGVGAGGALRDMLSTLGAALGALFGVGQRVVGFLMEHKTATIAAAVALGALVVLTKAHAAVLAVEAAGGLVAYIKNIQIVSTVTRAWAAVQWLINAALTANPIGIVIVAIAALAAGIIYAYKNSETFRNICDTAFRAIGAAARFMWNNVIAPVIRFLINGFATVADWIGNMLDALSHIPGFGWAKDAADKMHGAAGKAKELADKIKDIPDEVNIDVKLWAQFRGSQAAINTLTNQAVNKRATFDFRAGGGPVTAGRPYIVGEREPELFVPNTSGRIMNQSQIAAASADGVTLSAKSISDLARAIQGGPAPQVSVSQIDRGLAWRA